MKIRKITRFLVAILSLVMCATMFAACGGDNSSQTDARDEKYAEAYKLLDKGEYEAAYDLFVELGDYKDAAKETARFHYVCDSLNEVFGEPESMNSFTSVITLNKDNLPIKCDDTYLDGTAHTCTFGYDDKGRLITNECKENDEFYRKREWSFDENGNMLTYSFEYNEGSKYAEVRTYDDKGNNLTIVAEGTGGFYTTMYEDGRYYASYEILYDENGKNTSYYAIDGEETLEGELWYSEEGVLTKTLVKVTCGEEVSFEEELYDEKGNLSRKTITKNDEIFETSDFTYDENGNCLSEINKTNYEDGEYVITYKYTYDANGNCIKIEIEDSDGYTSIRNITYKFVYVPYDYSKEDWKTMVDEFFV